MGNRRRARPEIVNNAFGPLNSITNTAPSSLAPPSVSGSIERAVQIGQRRRWSLCISATFEPVENVLPPPISDAEYRPTADRLRTRAAIPPSTVRCRAVQKAVYVNHPR